MADKYKYVIFPEAQQDMQATYMYIALKFYSQKSTLNIVKKVRKAINYACTYPRACPPYVSEINPKATNLKKLIIDKYIIIYEICEEEKTIEILRFFNGVTDYQNKI